VPHNRGLTLIEVLCLIAIISILAIVVFTWPAAAEDADPRVPTYTTGVTVGPFHGGNSWPYTGTGIAIPLPDRDHGEFIDWFTDWKGLQADRAHAAAAEALNRVYFAFDSAVIEHDAEHDLDYVAFILEENPEVSLTLAGHTDLVGSNEYNDTLADRRADAVRDALIERGVPADRLTTRGFGESSPIDLILGRSLVNRRVEVVPSLDLP
jgi:prepilin-type N-terminal cleavage/methylation domain-containing protein